MNEIEQQSRLYNINLNDYNQYLGTNCIRVYGDSTGRNILANMNPLNQWSTFGSNITPNNQVEPTPYPYQLPKFLDFSDVYESYRYEYCRRNRPQFAENSWRGNKTVSFPFLLNIDTKEVLTHLLFERDLSGKQFRYTSYDYGKKGLSQSLVELFNYSKYIFEAGPLKQDLKFLAGKGVLMEIKKGLLSILMASSVSLDSYKELLTSTYSPTNNIIVVIDEVQEIIKNRFGWGFKLYIKKSFVYDKEYSLIFAKFRDVVDSFKGEIVLVDSMDEMFIQEPKIPQFKTLRQRQKFVKEFVEHTIKNATWA